MKKTYDIQNLDCANCAQSLEQLFSKLEGVDSVRVDFAREKLFIEGDIEQYTHLKLQTIARKIESKIIVSKDNKDKSIETNGLQKIELALNILGILILVVALILDFLVMQETSEIVINILYVTAYLLIGGKVIFKAVKGMLRGKIFDENFLMTIATIGALAINDYLEAVAVMLFYRVGEYLQDKSVERSRKNIKDLMDIKPTVAHVLVNNSYIDTEPEKLEVSQIILVKPGEKIPVDGVVIKGNSTIDTSSLTGESVPRDVYKDQVVLSGSLNIQAPLTIRVSKLYEDSTIALILEFIENNANKKAETEKFISKFARYYTPVVVTLAILLAFVFPFIVSSVTGVSYASEFQVYFKRALIFLVISCPCALVLSIPLSFFAGIGASSKKGVLFKSGSDLEIMKSIDHFVFDKTCTLTKGIFQVTNIISDQKTLLLEYAAHAESKSNHPIAKSILFAYGKEIEDITLDVKEFFGKGIEATYKNKHIYVGNAKFMEEQNISYHNAQEIGTIIHVSADNLYLGYMVINDQIKETSKSLIQTLLKQGKKVSMVTGDHKLVAEDIGKQLGIQNVYANCLPEEKAKIIEKLVETEKVAFIGDGINDAPVLIAAHLGIAMGGIGSDAAIEASDAVIMNDDPSQILVAQNISYKTMRIVSQNIILALGIKAIVLVLGALGFANLWLAIFADVGVSVLAVFNAMRIFKK